MICGQNRGCSDQSFWWFRAFRALEVDRFSIILHLFHIHNLCHTEISSPSIRIYDIIFRLRRIQRCLFIFLFINIHHVQSLDLKCSEVTEMDIQLKSLRKTSQIWSSDRDRVVGQLYRSRRNQNAAWWWGWIGDGSMSTLSFTLW